MSVMCDICQCSPGGHWSGCMCSYPVRPCMVMFMLTLTLMVGKVWGEARPPPPPRGEKQGGAGWGGGAQPKVSG